MIMILRLTKKWCTRVFQDSLNQKVILKAGLTKATIQSRIIKANKIKILIREVNSLPSILKEIMV